MNKIILFAIIVILAGAGFFYFRGSTEDSAIDINTEARNGSQNFTFENLKKSAHYETNSPEHGSVLAAAPINIVIDFNFDLAAPSSISVTKDGVEYGTGNTIIDANKLSMRRNLITEMPDGKYKVIYNACWPDGSCHDGHFEFAIDRSLASSYEDLTGQVEVRISMSEIMFKPKNIKISSGTKVTWINDEDVEHYVNTETHPAHTYFPAQNSRALKKGESYSTTFDMVGIYPYHCSAHASTMTGSILVER